jgi:hypothetical protein
LPGSRCSAKWNQTGICGRCECRQRSVRWSREVVKSHGRLRPVRWGTELVQSSACSPWYIAVGKKLKLVVGSDQYTRVGGQLMTNPRQCSAQESRRLTPRRSKQCVPPRPYPRYTPYVICQFTPELQRQSRGKSRIPQREGHARTAAPIPTVLAMVLLVSCAPQTPHPSPSA